MIELSNIKKTYLAKEDQLNALKNINIKFRKNEFVSILGNSGCGKTSLLNIIGGLDVYDDGDLLIDGKSTKEYKDKDWDFYRNNKIGFVFQDYNLIQHLSVLENVELALILSKERKEERRKKAISILEKLGIGDKLNKKPNQLSGGQVQRVAIARALVNNPDIILADEPTGSLDSKNGIQIMGILKEISKEKLVIMVTHNKELAEEYSDRIVNLFDGEIVGDTNPYKGDKEEKGDNKTKSSISFISTFLLSAKNLFSRKLRTIATSLAAAIGIAGVTLVLAISIGMKKSIDKLQNDTLSTYPLTITSEETFAFTELEDALNNVGINLERYPSVKEVYLNKTNILKNGITSNNKITQKYIDNVIKKIDPKLINDVTYDTGVELNFFTNQGSMKQISNGNEMYVKLVLDEVWKQMVGTESFFYSQYDVIEGKLPSKYNEVAIVVDRYNRLTDATLMALGLYKDGQNKKIYSFDELMNMEFKVLTNDEMYYFMEDKFVLDGVYINGHEMITKQAYDKGLSLNVSGIIRVNKETVSAAYDYEGVIYTSKLIDYILEKNDNSKLSQYLVNNVNVNPFTSEIYDGDSIEMTEEMYKKDLKKYGVDKVPTSIYIYPTNYEAKEEIKLYLDNYNSKQKDVNKISYIDYMSMIMGVISFVVDGVSNVMLILSIISLLVVSVMIAIITYISVLERTKEIGTLRSLGARKYDIAMIFNVETAITGLLSGLIGVAVGGIICVPINIFIGSLVVGLEKVALFKISNAFIVLLISIVIGVISGVGPSIVAAKKRPSEALRKE